MHKKLSRVSLIKVKVILMDGWYSAFHEIRILVLLSAMQLFLESKFSGSEIE